MPKYGPHRDPEARRRIVDATRELLSAHGARQVTINQIATAAGVGKQTIYRWWPSKTAIALDALEEMFDAENPLPETGSAVGDLRLQMRRVATSFRSPIGAIVSDLIAEAQGDAALDAAFRQRYFDRRRRRAAAIIEAAVERGEIAAGLDLGVVIDLLYGPLWLRFLVGHAELDDDAVDRLLDHAWRGLAPTAPTADVRSNE